MSKRSCARCGHRKRYHRIRIGSIDGKLVPTPCWRRSDTSLGACACCHYRERKSRAKVRSPKAFDKLRRECKR